MARLRKEMGLSETLLDTLKRNKVYTILDFIQEDPEKLSSMCDITFKEILDVRQKIITNFSSLPINGLSLYDNFLSSSALIPSGIESLDGVLGGGFLTGTVVELCGRSGDGKTQLGLTVAAHVATALKQTVHYVDTNGDFSAMRIKEIITQKNVPEQEIKDALDRIQVTRVTDIYELLRYLHHLMKSLGDDGSSAPRLVVVDSVPPLYFPFMGSNSTNQGFGLLANAMATMKAVATEYHVLFIEVNLASTVMEEDTCGGEAEDQPVSDVRPMLGKYWLHAPHTRLLVTRLDYDAPQRLVRVTKSTHLPLGASCLVTLSVKGVH